jgi:hypothetical protein
MNKNSKAYHIPTKTVQNQIFAKFYYACIVKFEFL